MPFLRISNGKIIFSKSVPSVGTSSQRSIPKASDKVPKTLPRSLNKHNKLDSVPKNGFIAQELGRRFVLLVAPLLFLPVRGCTTGGFYDTGITENCQKLYQPAAAAEARFKQKMASESENHIANDQQSRLERFEKGDQLLEKQNKNREALETEKRERTRKKVEEMWQSLE